MTRAATALTPPSSTTSRFVLLALTATAATAYIQESTAALVVPYLHLSWFHNGYACALYAQDDAPHDDAVTLTSGFGDCLHESAAHTAFLLWGMVAATLGAAVLLYLLHPVLLSRGRWRSAYDVGTLASSPHHTKLLATVNGALQEYALADRVRARIPALSSDRSARTYGRRRRYVLVLSQGLAVPRAARPNLLRHELAHIRNRDPLFWRSRRPRARAGTTGRRPASGSDARGTSAKSGTRTSA